MSFALLIDNISMSNKKNIDLSTFPSIWKDRLFAYIRRNDCSKNLRGWCAEQGIVYSTARNWITPHAMKLAMMELSVSVQAINSDLNTCSVEELSEEVIRRRTGENNDIPRIYKDILPDHEKKVFESLYAAGLNLKQEIAIVRLQIYRSKKLQIHQDESLAKEDDKAMTLVALDKQNNESKETCRLIDHDVSINRFGSLLCKMAETQAKIERTEHLTSEEEADVMSQVLKQVMSEQITAVNAGIILNSCGIRRIPVSLELKIREELKLFEPPVSNNPGVNGDDVVREAALLETQQEEAKHLFLQDRHSELESLHSEEED